MSKAEQLEREALALSPEERELLAGHIMQSLDGAPLNEVDAAWVEEAERRFQDFKSGKTPGIAGGEVFSQIRRELGWQR